MTLIDQGVSNGDGSYAWVVAVDEAPAQATFTDNIMLPVILAILVWVYKLPIAIVGALTALFAAGLRRLIAQKVEVSSPWLVLRLGGCALVASAVVYQH